MKKVLSSQGVYIGAGAGFILYALFGFLPGCLLGGAVGISIAGLLFGLPLEPGLLSRALILLSMIAGAVVSLTVTVIASSALGWFAGSLLRISKREKTLL
jgi:hypothetical protein